MHGIKLIVQFLPHFQITGLNAEKLVKNLIALQNEGHRIFKCHVY